MKFCHWQKDQSYTLHVKKKRGEGSNKLGDKTHATNSEDHRCRDPGNGWQVGVIPVVLRT